MIVEGKIKLARGAAIERCNERTVTLTTGAELPADLVVLATGYSSMSDWAAQLISPEVAAVLRRQPHAGAALFDLHGAATEGTDGG
jgi:hypothetical protein